LKAREFCERGCNLADGTVHGCVLLAVKVFFVRGVPTNLRFVLMLWGKEMVQTPRQPKHGIDAHEHPRYYSLFWLFFIFHSCKDKFFGHYYFLIVIRRHSRRAVV